MSRRNRSAAYSFFAALAALVAALFRLLSALAVLLARAVVWLAGRVHALAAAIPAKPPVALLAKTLPSKSETAEAPRPGPTVFQAPLLALVPALPQHVPAQAFQATATRAPRAPTTDLLTSQSASPAPARDDAKLQATANLLLGTLRHFGVEGTLEATLSGPTVTTFEVAPAPGTKAAKVVGLDDDLSLALGRKVRVLAPVPGKSRLGFEIANETSTKVALRDLLEDSRFETFAAQAALPVVLGRDMMGKPMYADLAAMPHAIVAGETGSGKSVGLNVMLLSLLYKRSPEQLKFLMIDPKAVELTPYNGLPHMLRPVVTDMDRAAEDLAWAVTEMDRRYQLFAATGVKNLASYNARATTEKLASVVIVIDEFADLILSNKKVEKLVTRLAQKSRAAGIHMIIATQRPSMNVITGTLKANCPTRMAFRVADGVNSRIILDEQGAENLLGRGDMLLKMNGETKRVQCPWVSEEEIARVTGALHAQGRAA